MSQKEPYLSVLVLPGDGVDVDREAHELGETLLTHESLSLQVALLHRLRREHT